MESYKTFTFTIAGEEGGQHERTEGGKNDTHQVVWQGNTENSLCGKMLFAFFFFIIVNPGPL